ncbi:MAG TPA: ABC transporter permease [Jatrophihabitantaceae bacterium]|nr:ABC transporter permease [Jatrophihabitantaceae bacterium]
MAGERRQGRTDTVRAGSRRVNFAAFSISKVSAIYLWIVFMIIFGVTQFHLFLTFDTTQLVFSQGAVTAVIALAFVVPLSTGTYDLSIGAMMSSGIVLTSWLGANTHLPMAVVVIAVVAFSGAVGAITGFVVVKLHVNSFIATLGMSQLLSAFQLFSSNNQQVPGNFSPAFLRLGNGDIYHIPYVILYLLAIAVVMWFVLEQTPIGRRMYAIGGNREAARLVGINVDRMVWGSLICSACIAGFAGVMYASQVGAYTSDVGPGYLFPALAAVFFGASQFKRRPNVWGTVIAYFSLAFGIQGLTLQYGAGAFWVSPLFQGVALVSAVALASRTGAVRVGRVRSPLRNRSSSEPAQPAPESASADTPPAEVPDAGRIREGIAPGPNGATPAQTCSTSSHTITGHKKVL